MALIECTECGGRVSTEAAACPHCGRPNSAGFCTDCGRAVTKAESHYFGGRVVCPADFTRSVRTAQAPGPPPAYDPQERRPSPGFAAVLSLFIPGAGQMYRGRIGSGLLWLVFVMIGYMAFIFPGLVLHLFCILSAARRN